MNTLLLNYSGRRDRLNYPVVARVADPDQACVTYRAYLGFHYECKCCRGYGTVVAKSRYEREDGRIDWYDDCPRCGDSTQPTERVPPGVCLSINPLVLQEALGQHDRF